VFIKLPLKYIADFKIVAIAVLYYLSAQLGHNLAFPETNSLPTWPPSGVAFALIILLGRSSWPGITIGALIGNLLAYWNHQELSIQSIIALSTLISFAQTSEALVGNFLVKVWIKDDYPFNRTKDTFSFLFVTMFICLIGAGISTLALYINNVVTDVSLLQTALHGWVGNVVGILLFTPFILALAQFRTIDFNSKKLIEGGVFITSVGVLYLLVRFGYFNETWINSLPYLLIPFLLWMAFRFNLLAAITVALGASLISIYFTIQNLGPFIQTSVLDSMLLLQLFIGVISVSTIVLSATVAERSKAEYELKLFNQTLRTWCRSAPVR
jgi:integral membrane sensor domain MASE1